MITMCVILVLSYLSGQIDPPPAAVMKEFVPAGRIEALIDDAQNDDYLLVQLDLKNDSLFNLVNSLIPNMELFSGPASYHRIMELRHLEVIQEVISEEFYQVLEDDYSLPGSSREFWLLCS